jgi:hypothetical protein
MTKSSEPRALKEIHEIREMIYEETKHLSPQERADLTNTIGKEIAEKYRLKIRQNEDKKQF